MYRVWSERWVSASHGVRFVNNPISRTSEFECPGFQGQTFPIHPSKGADTVASHFGSDYATGCRLEGVPEQYFKSIIVL
jgi:hypothetical protein